MLCMDIRSIRNTIDGCLIQEAKEAKTFGVPAGNGLLLSGIQIQDRKHRGVISVFSFCPGKIPAGSGGTIAVLLQPGNQKLCLARGHIDPVNTAIHTDIKVISVCGNIVKRLHVFFQKLIILLHLHKEALGNTGICGIEIINGHAGLTFVISPVHVTADQEIHVSRLIDIDDLNIILIVGISGVRTVFLWEAEDLYHLVSGCLIFPQCSLTHKGHTVTLEITQIFHIPAGDPEINAGGRDDAGIFRIEDLIYCPFEIQQTDPFLRVKHPVILGYRIELRLIVLVFGRDHIVHHNSSRAVIDLLQARSRFVIRLRAQGSPAQLIHATMDIRKSKGGIISLFIGLNVGGNRFQIILVQASLIEAHGKIQITFCMEPVLIDDPGIIIQHLTSSGELQLQRIFRIDEKVVLKTQRHIQAAVLFLRLVDLGIFQCPGTVST